MNNSSHYTHGKDHAQQFFLSGRNKNSKAKGQKAMMINNSKYDNMFETGEYEVKSKEFKRASTFEKTNP